MAEAGKLPFGATPGKLGLIGVLAVVFVGVLVFQFGGMFFGAPNSQRPAPIPTRDMSADQDSGAVPSQEALLAGNRPRPQWPQIEIDDALAHDPFAVGAPLAVFLGPEPEPEVDPSVGYSEADQAHNAMLRETARTLQSLGVSMIFDAGRGPIATVGDRVLQVGDTIGGFRVVEISIAKGVVLEPLDESETEFESFESETQVDSQTEIDR